MKEKPSLALVQKRLEERERHLSPLATQSSQSRGRERPEEPSLLRTEFQRDRDRILHCNAFRRLKHKTQVFIAPTGDHFVTRLTHTLEVAQIARTVARALNLNEDLAEAIALGHDIGHPPFGHAGEEALAEALLEVRARENSSDQPLPPEGGFRHAEQSLRVVEILEKGERGLNLTWEVRDGIINSSKVRADILAEGYGTPSTLEGQIVKIADAVAYLNHDIADAIRAGLLLDNELPESVRQRLGVSHSQRINALVSDIVESSWWATGEGKTDIKDRHIGMSKVILDAANELREYMFQRVYLWEGRRHEAEQAKQVVRFLFDYYTERPKEAQSDYQVAGDPVWRQVTDYISGMTDRFALSAAKALGYAK